MGVMRPAVGVGEGDGSEEVRWAPRVAQHKIRRLYETDARGIVDEEQIDEVGYGLEARCRSILTIAEAQAGRVHCPRCARAGQESLVPRAGGLDEPLRCATCGWRTTWRAYHKTYQGKQLNPGGATEGFRAYVRSFALAHSPREKMVAIDQVLHTFHVWLLKTKVEPTRIAGVNLIGGTMHEVIEFLDGLTYREESTPGLQETHAVWRAREGRRRELWGRATWRAPGVGVRTLRSHARRPAGVVPAEGQVVDDG